MKKILAILMALCLMFTFAACGGNQEDNSSSEPKPPVSSDIIDDEDTDFTESLVLDGKDEYVVCVKYTSDLKISKISEIEGLNVAAQYDSDGQKIAEYYGANFVGYNGENDAISELCGGDSLDCVIVKKLCGEGYAKKSEGEYKVAIILDPIVIE